jgi:capsular polysaccharide biosynthesis protein
MAADEDEIELGWYLRVLQRRWKLATAGALIGGGLGFGYASIQPLRYEGVTTILIPANNPQLNPPTFRRIAENATLASQVVSELKLGEGDDAFTPSRFVEDALRIEEVRGTSLVRVKVTLPDPRTAAEASRTLAAKAIALTREVIPQRSTIEEQFMTRLSEAQQELASAQQALMTHKQNAHADLLGRTAGPSKRQAELLHLLLEIEGEDARLALAQGCDQGAAAASDPPAGSGSRCCRDERQPQERRTELPLAGPSAREPGTRRLTLDRGQARSRLEALNKQLDSDQQQEVADRELAPCAISSGRRSNMAAAGQT